jgi:hypothetical protein
MKKIAVGIMIIFAVCLMVAPVSFAQSMQSAQSTVQPGAWALGVPQLSGGEGFTGSEAIVTEKGTVKKVEKMKGVKDGLQLKFKSDLGSMYTVYMGPKWFVENQKLKFMAGDKVEVRGKKFQSYIIATEISKGDWTMKLRDEEDGNPSWQCCFPKVKGEE